MASHSPALDAWSGQVRSLENGLSEMDFLVPGMHCAGCMRKIEGGLSALDAVTDARANLSTRRVRVRWQTGAKNVENIRAAIESLGFDAAPFDARLADQGDNARSRSLLRGIAISGFAAANVMLLSVSVWAGLFSDMDGVTRQLFHWISALIALPAVAYAGQPFFRSAASALKVGQMNMDVPISLGVILASGASLLETMRGAEHVYFDAAISLVFFLLIGRYLESAMRSRAGEAARNLLAIRSVAAIRIDEDGERRSVPVEALMPGDRVFVAPGMRVPADGAVADGASDVDMSLLSGESVPERALAGDNVYAGTLNLSGPLLVDIKAASEDTLLAQIARLMEAAEQGRAGFVRLADRIARFYAPMVHLLAAGTFVGWMLIGAGWHPALMTAVSVLIITCPCALGLAVPVVQVVASGVLLRLGVLVKSADGLERLGQIDEVVFDKTGTLTLGVPDLVNGDAIPTVDLALAAALASQSRHPLSQAVAAVGAGLPMPKLEQIHEVPGYGVEGILEGRKVRLGRRDWVVQDQSTAAQEDDNHSGPDLWLSGLDGSAWRFLFHDRLRPDAQDVVAALLASGKTVRLLSGDREAVVAQTAAQLGITHWQARCSPADKIAALNALSESGKRVLMVGDGLNDAPALRAAHVSMSPASAADISQTAADFVFQSESLRPVLHSITIAHKARNRVLENFGLAFSYNLVAVPLAVLGFVTPLIAAVAMSSSSILVTLNALRLRTGSGGRP